MHPVPAAKDAILTLLAAHDPLDGIKKQYSPPTEGEDIKFSMIFLGEATDIPDDDWSQLGAQRRRMRFRLPFTIVALVKGDDARAADQAAWSLYEEFVEALRADPTLGGSVQQFDAMPARGQSVPTGTQQWEGSVQGHVVCTSRAY